jgi:hypothetical protein
VSRRAALLAAAALAGAAPAVAAPDEAPLEGVEVARRINARDEGRQVSRIVRWELVDRQGDRRTRETRVFRKTDAAARRTVLFFLAPENLRDTAFLTVDHHERGRDDDQWLYLPAARKVRRVSATDRGEAFLGSDLSYEDVKLETRVGLEDYRWTMQAGEEVVDGHHCLLLEAVPVDETTARELGYGRVLLRVDPELWMVRRAEYWDPGGRLLKTAGLGDIRLVDGIWTVHRVEMANAVTGHRTILGFDDVDYTTPVDDDLFTERALARGVP